MRFRKRVFATVMVLLGILIDTSILPFTGVDLMLFPRFSLIAALTVALLMGATQGIIYGTVGGIILDVTLTQPTGLTTAVYIACAMICGWFSHARRRSMLSTVFGPLFSLTIYELVYLIYYYFATQNVSANQLIFILVRVVIGVVVIQPLYLLFLKVLKPRRSRYAR